MRKIGRHVHAGTSMEKLIRKVPFVAQCRREAGLSDDLA